MNSIVRIYSSNFEELSSFLNSFWGNLPASFFDRTYWQYQYENPIEIADIVAAFIDNKDNFLSCNMWVSLDKNTFINITDFNYNSFIKYLYERYPY